MRISVPPQLNQLYKQISGFIGKLERRERILLGIAVAVIVGMGLDKLNSAIGGKFRALSQLEADLQSDMNDSVVLMARYRKLKARRDNIQEAYQKIEMSEGALSYLESLLRDKAKLQPADYRIEPKAEQALGGGYKQTPFSLTITFRNDKEFFPFLQELVSGRRPFILSKLELRKPTSNDRLEVKLDVASMQKAQPPPVGGGIESGGQVSDKSQL